MPKNKMVILSLFSSGLMATQLYAFFPLGANAKVVGSSASHSVGAARTSGLSNLESPAISGHDVVELSLNGRWELGVDRRYERVVEVPGLATDPRQVNKGTLWYRRKVKLPPGNWTHATLTLNGARFCPTVYVNGEKVSEAPGGMTVTTHLLRGTHAVPGKYVVLEVALKSLKDVDPQDASRIPKADQWRSNLSSGLWDKATLRLHGPARITRLIPSADLKNDLVNVNWEFEKLVAAVPGLALRFEILSRDGERMATAEVPNANVKGAAQIPLFGRCRYWSPENPVTYRLRATLSNGSRTLDAWEITLGIREFRTHGLGFRLNGKPIQMRGGTVVWQRWLRDPEAKELAFDVKWFEKNVVLRLKEHGANTLHFSLYTPPEAFLDLCDKHGLLVQHEWIFFHGVEASKESMIEQWRAWLDLAVRHPSVVIIHAWNETESDRLEAAWAAMESLCGEYPPLVVSHRDVTHVHKYWWSMFENLGLYYDSAAQFDRPIIVDEFGGNYLDGRGNPGGYPTLKESFLRFLGPGHTKALRLQLHTEASSQVAEYWRRLGVAGFGPFCILGSPEDGNHWYMGKLKDGVPKLVWRALTAAFSQLSCSLEVWDRNFLPGQTVTLPLYFFNDTDSLMQLEASVAVVAEGKEMPPLAEQKATARLKPHSKTQTRVTLQLPDTEGHCRFQATLQNPPASVKYPVVSSWRFRTLRPKVPLVLHNAKVGVPEEEKELKDFLRENKLLACGPDDPEAKLIVTSRATWEKVGKDTVVLESLQQAVRRGQSVVMLDIGPINLGAGYTKGNDRGPVWQQLRVANPEVVRVPLFYGIEMAFREAAEPESHLHPTNSGTALWENLDRQATWLWNGLRGGLIVPATDMTVAEVSPDAFITQWQSRGAVPSLIKEDSYFAYELQGFYAFSRQDQDTAVMQALRDKVEFLVEDAPALAVTIKPSAPIQITDLAAGYRKCQNSSAQSLRPLAYCGKNLSRIAVIQLEFGPGQGTLILSQLLTAGRLARGYGQAGLYGIRYDPAAVQYVLNMLQAGLQP